MSQESMHALGWITFSVSKLREEEARSRRAQRDLQYCNIYDEEETDERWVGELGEMAFNHWLQIQDLRASWIIENAAGRFTPDRWW